MTFRSNQYRPIANVMFVDKNSLRIMMVLTFTMTLFFFSIIFSLNAMISDSDSRCPKILDHQAVMSVGKAIHTKSMAEKVLKIYASNKDDANIRYRKSSMEFCGAAYLFIDRTDKKEYVVCENGNIYQFVFKCND